MVATIGRRVRPGTIGMAFLLGLALVAAVSWIAGEIIVRPWPTAVPPAAPPAADFFLAASDGTRIAATYRPGRAANSPAILILHGVHASRSATAANAEWLARLGYASLAIDFRGHGASDRRRLSFGLEESRDAAAAFRWLKRRQRGARVAVVGISLGGAAALLGEAGPLAADALVLQAVYTDIRRAVRTRIASRVGAIPAYALEPLLSVQSWPRFGVPPSRLSPLAALRRYSGPVLVIGGLADRSSPPEEARAMFAAAPGAQHLWLIPGKGHGAISDLADPAYRHRLAAFLARNIGPP